MNKKDIINEYLNEEIDGCEHALNYVREVENDPDLARPVYINEIYYEASRRLVILKILRNDLNESKE